MFILDQKLQPVSGLLHAFVTLHSGNSMKYLNTFNKAILAVTIAQICQFSYAAEQNSENEIERIEVIGQASYRSTATKSTLSPINSPVSVSVLDQELLNQRQADSVTKALRYVSGVTTESRASITIFDQFNMRGFDTYQSFYDGLPLLTNNLWNLYPQVDAFATESIEVLKGPASSLYGLVPPGGLVNQVAKYPTGSEQAMVRATIGSHGMLELGADISGQLHQKADYRLVLLGKKRDGQQVTTENERITIAPTVTLNLSEKTTLSLNAYYQNDPKMVPSTPLPAIGTLYSAPYGKLASDAYSGDKNWNRFEREVLMLGYKLNHQFESGWTFLQKFRFTDAHGEQRNMYNNGLADDQQTLTRAAYRTNENIEGFVLDNQLSGLINTGNLTHHLLFGFDYQDSESDVNYQDTLGTQTASIDLSNPNHNLLNITQLPLDFYSEAHDINIQQKGLYAQDEIKFNKLSVILNARFDKFNSQDKADNVYNGAEYGSNTKIDQNQFSGRIAAMYAFDSGLRPYVNYSESFEPVSGVDSVTDQTFKPTTAQQKELGIKYQSDDNSITFTSAYFDITKQNVVVNTPDFAQKTQTGEVESKGFEFELKTQITDDFILTTNYTHLDMEVTKDKLDPELVGKTPVWVAEEMASVWANYYFSNTLEGLMLGGGARYVGKSQLDKYNTDTVPSYTLLDAVMAYKLANHDVQITGSVSNITDKRFVGACYDANNCWMGADRTVELGIQVGF